MQRLFLKNAWAPALAGISATLAVALALHMSGAFDTDTLPYGFDNAEQVLGLLLLFVLLPGYLLFAWGTAHRRSHRLLGQLDAICGHRDFSAQVHASVPILATGAIVGICYSLTFNLAYTSFVRMFDEGPASVAIGIGQIVIWVAVGLTLASRIHVARLFLRMGRTAPLDLYEQSPLEPFARNGMGDMLLVAGALVLTTVQSLDATFRYQNYLYAFIVAIPAALALVLTPMMSVHRRLKAAKADEYEKVQELIRQAPRQLGTAQMDEFEGLLQRRDRIRAAATWPMDVAMVYRVVLYGVLPPAAWTLAALVEMAVEQALAV